MRFVIFICVIALNFWFCSNTTAITKNEVDRFISKYNDVKFDELKNVSITQRSRNVDEIVYVVGKGEGYLPVYFVTFNLRKNEITKIDMTNLEKSKVQDYLTKEEIVKAINAIMKYNFFLFVVDSLDNVYINPFYANEPPYLLRLKTYTGDSILQKGYVYELYKNKWYLNRTRRKE